MVACGQVLFVANAVLCGVVNVKKGEIFGVLRFREN